MAATAPRSAAWDGAVGAVEIQLRGENASLHMGSLDDSVVRLVKLAGVLELRVLGGRLCLDAAVHVPPPQTAPDGAVLQAIGNKMAIVFTDPDGVSNRVAIAVSERAGGGGLDAWLEGGPLIEDVVAGVDCG